MNANGSFSYLPATNYIGLVTFTYKATDGIATSGVATVTTLLTHNTGGKPFMVYDGVAGAGDTRVTPPSSVVPEAMLPLAGLAIAIPLITGRRRLIRLLQLVRR